MSKKAVEGTSKREFSILDHDFVPKHEILSQKEKEELLAKYLIKPYQLPKILLRDPAVQVIDAKVGDIIKITRKSPTAGVSYYHRLVVEEIF